MFWQRKRISLGNWYPGSLQYPWIFYRVFWFSLKALTLQKRYHSYSFIWQSCGLPWTWNQPRSHIQHKRWWMFLQDHIFRSLLILKEIAELAKWLFRKKSPGYLQKLLLSLTYCYFVRYSTCKVTFELWPSFLLVKNAGSFCSFPCMPEEANISVCSLLRIHSLRELENRKIN